MTERLPKSCPRCNGSGKINDGGSIAFPIVKTCPTCKGYGEIGNSSRGELEKFAKEQTKRHILKELLRQRETLPCAYGGGDVISSYWHLEGREEDVRKVAVCIKARQLRDSWIGQIPNRMKELSKMGCPEPRHRFLFGWRCKYADGKVHPY
jgi:hypothetical protein